METSERVQGMLCERINQLEKVVAACAKKVDNLHSNINVMENRRHDEDDCRNAAAGARTRIRETVEMLEDALP